MYFRVDIGGGRMTVIVGLAAAMGCGIACTAGAYVVDKVTRR